MNALSGKIMFRDVVYITHDYTIRVQDGYLIFRWWRSYVPKDVSEGNMNTNMNFFNVTNILWCFLRFISFGYEIVCGAECIRITCIQSIRVICSFGEGLWTKFEYFSKRGCQSRTWCWIRTVSSNFF